MVEIAVVVGAMATRPMTLAWYRSTAAPPTVFVVVLTFISAVKEDKRVFTRVADAATSLFVFFFSSGSLYAPVSRS